MKHVYNIPFGYSFINEVAKNILNKYTSSPEQLASLIIIVPNERSISNLQNSFLKYADKSALILPKIISISDIDYFFDQLDINKLSEQHKYELSKRVISTNTRLYMLSRIVKEKFSDLQIYQTFVLAKELAQIIDKSYCENVDLNLINDLQVEYILSEHWKENITFLPIIYNLWQEILTNINAIDTVQRKNLIYNIQADQIFTSKHNIIALNIISTSPYILNLLKNIHHYINGQLYFYGIDNTIYKETNIQELHPQYEIIHTISHLDIKEHDILDLQEKTSKEHIIHRIFDDKIATHLKQKEVISFFDHISIMQSTNESEEAKAIALLVKENLTNQKKNIGIISNDVNTIFRIKTELLRFNIGVTNYLGEPLLSFPACRFMILLITVVANNFEPNMFLSLLKHSFFNMGYNKEDLDEYINFLDLYILREPIIDISNNNLENIINTYENKKNNIIFNKYILSSKKDKNFVSKFENFLNELHNYFDKIISFKNNKNSFYQIVLEHIKISENLTLKNENGSQLWENQEGKELSLFFSKLMEEADIIEDCNVEEYLYILNLMMNNINVLNSDYSYQSVSLYNSLQSNLIHHDMIIIANLNEGIMPFEKKSNPWLNKYICKQINLSTSNQQVGIQSNYFCQQLGSPEIILSRPEKINNKVNSPSRFLLLLNTLANCYKISSSSLFKKKYILNLAKHLDSNIKDIQAIKIDSPAITPPKNRLPTSLYATHLETLNKNPYEFFITKILKLTPLEKISQNLTHTLYGTLVHNTLEKFFINVNTIQHYELEKQIPIIQKLADEEFKILNNNIVFYNTNYQKLSKSLTYLLKYQQNDIKHIKSSYLEIKGSNILKLNNDVHLEIASKTDRIDLLNTHDLIITDYKTSKPNTKKYAMQLDINHYLINNNGFKELPFDIYKSTNIQTRYIYLPKNSIETTTKDLTNLDIETYADNILTPLLYGYYVENKAFEFIDTYKRDIKEEYFHFSRYSEWSTKIDFAELQKDEEKDEQ